MEPVRTSSSAQVSLWLSRLPGLCIALAVALVASVAGAALPLVGASVFGILIGIVAGSVVTPPASTKPGLDYASKAILKAAVVLLGASMSLSQILRTGLDSLVLIVVTLAAAFGIAALLASRLKTGFGLSSLIASGTAICGGSAIAAVAPCIEADDKDVAYAISVVFLFNVVAVFLFPPLGMLLGMSQKGFGLFAGTAINDTSSVLAAGYAFGVEAGDQATIVKLTRTLMIVPVSLVFAFIGAARKRRAQEAAGTDSGSGKIAYDFRKAFPWFVLGFIAMAILRTLGIVPAPLAGFLKDAGRFLIVLALSAIGLKTNVRSMIKAGPRPLLLGLGTWVAVTLASLAVQVLRGEL